MPQTENSTHQRSGNHRRYDVEVLDADDLWAKFGPKLPESLPPNPKKMSSHRWRRFGICSAGAVFTIVLHGLLLSSIFLGTASRPRVPPLSDGAAASAKNSAASEFVSTLIILNDHSITDPDTQIDSAYEVLLKELDTAPKEEPVIAQLASISQPEISGSEDGKDADALSIEAAGDDAGHAKLFGQYMDQIKARVERAWDQPTAPANGKFQCRVEIVQGEHGEVKEVTLQRCNGDSAWQLSLVQAIQRASPLPAPPIQKVFSAVIKLNFEANSSVSFVNAAVR